MPLPYETLSSNYYTPQTQEVAKGAASGMQDAGQAAGAIAGGLGSAISFGQDIAGRNQYYKNMQFINQQPITQEGAMPSIGGVSALRGQYTAIDPETAGKGLVGKGAMAGAQLGGAIGSAIPGVGTLFGAGAGALAGTIAGLFGKKSAEKSAEQAEMKGKMAFQQAQQDYNVDVADYYTGVQEQRQDIQAERAYQQRVYGLGNFNSPFASVI